MKSTGLEKRVAAFIKRLDAQDVCMHGFILSVGGDEKARAYYAPFCEGQAHRMYSVSKTMTALAVGILLDEGKIHLDDRISDYFPDNLPQNPDERMLRMTIRQMLPMTTCFRSTAYRESDDDWTKPFFVTPSTHEAGTAFYYDTGCSQVLCALVERLSGQSALSFLTERVFSKIGANDEKRWLTDRAGVCQGGTGLCMSLRDLHRTALCVMKGGQGVLPEWFCREMGMLHVGTDMQTNPEERYGYGWQCWRTRAGYAMYGLGAQLAVMCPDKDALLCTIADTRLDPVGVQRVYDAFFEEIYPYIGAEDMPFAAYDLHMRALSCACPQAAPEGVLNIEYRFDEQNMLGLRSLRVKENALVIRNAFGSGEMPFGLGKNVKSAFPGWEGTPALCSGAWLPGGRLHVRCFAVGDSPCGAELLLTFAKGCVTVQARRSYDPVTQGYDGVATGYCAQA